MEDIVIQVDVKDAIFFSEMKNYGKMRDAVKEFYSTYRGGTIYGLIGECGSGGWGISSLLCGKTHPDGSRVLINNIEFFSEELKKCGWYVGEGEGGGGISWLLSGREEIEEEEITVFGRKYSLGESSRGVVYHRCRNFGNEQNTGKETENSIKAKRTGIKCGRHNGLIT